MECGLAGFIEAAEGDLGGAEVLAEEVDGSGTGLKGMSKSMGMSWVSMAEKKGARRSRTVASSPQRTAGGMPGGGGTWLLLIRNILPVKLAGFQLAIARRPPGLRTRANSASYQFRAGGKHGTEHGDDDVEGGVGVGQGFGVAFVELDAEAFGGGAHRGLGRGGWGAISTPVTMAPKLGGEQWRGCRVPVATSRR